MPNYNAPADLHRLEFSKVEPGKKLAHDIGFQGSVAECVRKVMAKRAPDAEIYSMMTGPEAGLSGTIFNYAGIEAIYRRPDFPK